MVRWLIFFISNITNFMYFIQETQKTQHMLTPLLSLVSTKFYYKSNSSIPEVPFIIIFTYLLTPWCRVLLEKLTGLQLVKKFPAFY